MSSWEMFVTQNIRCTVFVIAGRSTAFNTASQASTFDVLDVGGNVA
jgi:hypothetical protein